MKEFGSDFHYVSSYNDGIIFSTKQFRLYANGRQALLALLLSHKWKRIWIPVYYCYDIIAAIKKSEIEIIYYDDAPWRDDEKIVSNLFFQGGDVLLRVNYFGIRSYRNAKIINIPVIEDHTNDLLSNWANNSNANYCFASLRKTLPVPEGGVLWSPLNEKLPKQICSTLHNDNLVNKRLVAMLLKREYLEDKIIDKSLFRNLYTETEGAFDSLAISGMSDVNRILLQNQNVSCLYEMKKKNWLQLKSLLDNKISILNVEDIVSSTPFSLVLVFDNEDKRLNIRNKLIEKKVYAAILWPIPNLAIQFEKHLLSVHCDARYSTVDIIKLAKIINQVFVK